MPSNPPFTDDDPVGRDLVVDLELSVARALRGRGELDQAEQHLLAAAARVASPTRHVDLGTEWLAVARAWARKRNASDTLARAEHALRRGAELNAKQGIPALAQHLQRVGRIEEAIAYWQQAIRFNPGETGQYLALARAYAQGGQAELALGTYLETAAMVPASSTTLVVADRLDELAASLPEARPERQIKIALLGSATLDHLQSYVKVACYGAGLRPRFYQGGFDQYTQEILDTHSGLYRFAPDLVVCAIHPSRVFPVLQHYPFDLTIDQRRAALEEGLETIRCLLDRLTQHGSAMVLLHNMVAPRRPALGPADLRDELGQTAIFAEINARLAELVRTRYSNVHVIDEDRVQARTGKDIATDHRLWFTARMPWSDSALVGLTQEYMRFIQPYKALGRKCIALDLDNTLWGGVVGEDGVDGIQLGAEAPGNAFVAFQQALEVLWRRGILLATCSKNNPEDVQAVFDRHPAMVLKSSHFAAQRVNWASKADNLRELAHELNIGLDSIVFLDDNPVERAKIRAELPQVLVPELPTDPAEYRDALLDLTVFDVLSLTEEDRTRNKLYADQKSRREFAVEQPHGGTLDAYLAGLQMVVEIAPASNLSLPRIAQLTNKTNQFNLTTRRYSEVDITSMLSRGWRVLGMRVADRFGDNGLVGVAISAPGVDDSWEIDTLLLSCRVMGRGVETALLACIADEARRAGAARLYGWFVPTAKNVPVRDCYRDHGFTLLREEADGRQLWEFDLTHELTGVPVWLDVRTPELVA